MIRLIIIFLLCISSVTAIADKKSALSPPDWTVAPKELEPDVQFWVDVYSKYDNDTAILHDTEYMGVHYAIVDLHDLHCIDDCPEDVKQARIDRVKVVKDHVREILLTLAKNPPDGALSPEAKKIKLAWRKWTTANVFKDAADDKRLRSQTGQKTRFQMGLPPAEKYMPKFEAIFKNEGMPIVLTRLVFVESMFNMNALSHAGASGVWQFMPATARKYGLQVSRGVDERNDPVLSARAAARMLKYDYDIVGTWPLAINSYNAGRGHLERAIAALGTRDMVKIIRNYRVGSYGFASRNYYPEFLAACEVYNNRATYFPNTHPARN